MDTIKVVCGLIFHEEKVFICRRKPSKSMGGYWEFPGGKVEVGENYADSLTRELQEELEMTVDVQDHFKTILHDYATFRIELIAFFCQLKASHFILTDHDAYAWATPSALLDWSLTPADVPIAEALIAFSKTQ